MYTKDIGSTFEKNLKNEWILTNGIGGYCSSTIIGTNSRKYHGLLIANVGKNLDRYLCFSKFNEYVELKENKYSITSNECLNYIEKGYVYQEEFQKDVLPEFLYNVQGVELVKKICMVYGENKICIRYNIVNTNKYDASLLLMPLVNYRNIHDVKNASAYKQEFENDVLTVHVSSDNSLFIKVSDSSYRGYENTFYNDLHYRVEKDRGFDAVENEYMPGEFRVVVPASSQKEVFVVVEFNNKSTIDDEVTPNLIRNEEIRLEKICKIASAKTEIEKRLAIAADQFIITKNGEKTIIAGYPWFQDWGRDTFIALEGLTLKTNRFDVAKSILKYFANYIKKGLVPNFINEKGGGSYNTVDASLWYIEAIYRYVKYTNDLDTLKELFPKMLEIMYCYMCGTDYSIGMMEDGLITAGDKNTQLTWMDAKVLDYIPTPRYGKAVEINSLWYNAIKVMENLNQRLVNKYAPNTSSDSLEERLKAIYEINDNEMTVDEDTPKENLFLLDAAKRYYEYLAIVFDGRLSKKVKDSFKKFYNDEGLYDTIDPYNGQVRPNQIIALSLSFPVVSGDKAKEILELVKNELLTDKGLRTLAISDKDYRGKYEGDSFARDSSYHQGTVWTWLLGEYAKAYKYIYKKEYVATAVEQLLDDGMIGSIAEIYDGDEPRQANGALAQAWSVAEIIGIVF